MSSAGRFTSQVDGTGFALGAAGLLVAAAALGSRAGSRAVFAGQRLPEALVEALDSYPPEVAVRLVMLMEVLPDALRNIPPTNYLFVRPKKTKLLDSMYLGARGMSQLRRDIAVVLKRARGTTGGRGPAVGRYPHPDDEDVASLAEVVGWMRAKLSAREWYRGEWWVDQNPEMPVHWGPYVPWVAGEIGRILRDLPPVRVRGSRVASKYRFLVELDVDKICKLTAYYSDVSQLGIDQAWRRPDRPRRPSGRVRRRVEYERWKRLGMDEVFPRADPREIDTSARTGLVLLGGRKAPDMNRYSMEPPKGALEKMFGLILPTRAYPNPAPPPPPEDALIALHLWALGDALVTIRKASWSNESGRGWYQLKPLLDAGTPYPEVLKGAKRIVKESLDGER